MQNVFCQTTEWALIHNTLLLKTDRKALVAIPCGIIHWRSRSCCRQKFFCCIVPHQPRHSAAEHIQLGTLEPNTISLILSVGTNTTSPPTCPPATHLSHNTPHPQTLLFSSRPLFLPSPIPLPSHIHPYHTPSSADD